MRGNQQETWSGLSLAADSSRHFKPNQGSQTVTVKNVGYLEVWGHRCIQSINERAHAPEGRL